MRCAPFLSLPSSPETNTFRPASQAMRKSRAEFAVATAASNGKGLHVSKSRADRKAMFQKLSETADATVQGEAKPNVDKQVDKYVFFSPC
jgi:hypothetical protein